MSDPKRTSLLGIIGGLMLAGHLGDVRDELDLLCDLVGIERFEGGFSDGWTKADFSAVGIEPDEDDEDEGDD